MEIITLVKAGLRNRKGIFFGFAFLTAIIIVSVVTVIGVSKNHNKAVDMAFEEYDKGVIYAYYSGMLYNEDELVERFGKSDLIESMQCYPMVVGYNIHCNGTVDGNIYVFMKLHDKLPLFNDDATELIAPEDVPKLKKGEIYIPYGCVSKLNASIGDEFTTDFIYDTTSSFTVKGFVQEPFLGSSNIGIKNVFISDEDFDAQFPVSKSFSEENEVSRFGTAIYFRPSAKAYEQFSVNGKLSSDKLLRELNLKYKLSDLAMNSMSRETSERYSGIFMNVIIAVVAGVVILLLAIYLIVVGHNVSTEMDIDYVNLGILKSQGITDATIRIVYALEYLFVEAIGIILGIIISIPVERWLGRVFFSITSILPFKHIPIGEALLVGLCLFAITAIYIFLFTAKVKKTSPVKAITNRKSDFEFVDMINLPISKRFLNISLGMRQLTSAPKRYISIVVVSALLVYAIITTMLMSDYIVSKNALKSMGEPFCNIYVAYNELMEVGTIDDIEAIIGKYGKITERVYTGNRYNSLNGESILNVVNVYPEEYCSVYKGRNIKYDNEVIVTESVADLMDIKIGDTVTLGEKDKNSEFVVVGIFQTMSDLGKAIMVSLDGYSRLREVQFTVDDICNYGFEVEFSDENGILSSEDEKAAGQKLVDELKAKYGDSIQAEYQNFEDSMSGVVDGFYVAADASGIMIYVLTFIFGMVTVIMVCTKAFIQERKDIGIERAMGFTVGKVRQQFAMRFMLISLISGAIGVLLARFCSRPLLELLFSMFGVSHINLEYNIKDFLIPFVVFALFYMIFGFMASRSVKKVSSRELITE